ncbi:sigma 54-interacting transcriptional regulator [Pseudomonas agarici]|uniref:sigma 54-interacting transcriptional regulator n=1 Tax=Pseudomonas agarici TaxID=46677 RepID=UPI0002DD2174|nr:sigma-54 dependent transcriptional regulator [Pseudomonas agarici]NWB92708.1 sigma-54-dependent Fis family transcriptional regulator [Pseudomonas agarici]NWC10668.1 sigma-54-dependent Fis family transcriptional regulator [Pseudomonas agarici]SEL12583.1 regulatory protein, Fis family [Pseudomonas agarici]
MGVYDCFDCEFDSEKEIPNIKIIAQSTSQLGIDLLLSGETGTGKDTLAQRIHELSGRSGPFVAMNCAAIPESLAESELFGVVSGAFTGANRSRMGYIESAQGGTLYLDEIDSMPLNLQAKLLRVLEVRAIERLGSTTVIPLELCVIASAQRPLGKMVEEGLFRRDLYFRLNVLTIQLPALRERREQIIPLFSKFVSAANRDLGRGHKPLSASLAQMLLSHSWPGNIRELKSAAKRFVLGFPLLGGDGSDDVEGQSLKAQMRVIERTLIQEALKRHGQSVDAVSMELGLPRRTLYHRIKTLDIFLKSDGLEKKMELKSTRDPHMDIPH